MKPGECQICGDTADTMIGIIPEDPSYLYSANCCSESCAMQHARNGRKWLPFHTEHEYNEWQNELKEQKRKEELEKEAPLTHWTRCTAECGRFVPPTGLEVEGYFCRLQCTLGAEHVNENINHRFDCNHTLPPLPPDRPAPSVIKSTESESLEIVIVASTTLGNQGPGVSEKEQDPPPPIPQNPVCSICHEQADGYCQGGINSCGIFLCGSCSDSHLALFPSHAPLEEAESKNHFGLETPSDESAQQKVQKMIDIAKTLKDCTFLKMQLTPRVFCDKEEPSLCFFFHIFPISSKGESALIPGAPETPRRQVQMLFLWCCACSRAAVLRDSLQVVDEAGLVHQSAQAVVTRLGRAAVLLRCRRRRLGGGPRPGLCRCRGGRPAVVPPVQGAADGDDSRLS